MATKKPVAKPTTKKSSAKKPATKSAAAKVKTTKSNVKTPASVKAKKKATETHSFRLSRESENFISSRFTIQTVYWLVLALVILVFGIMILQAQLSIIETLDQISEGL